MASDSWEFEKLPKEPPSTRSASAPQQQVDNPFLTEDQPTRPPTGTAPVYSSTEYSKPDSAEAVTSSFTADYSSTAQLPEVSAPALATQAPPTAPPPVGSTPAPSAPAVSDPRAFAPPSTAPGAPDPSTVVYGQPPAIAATAATAATAAPAQNPALRAPDLGPAPVAPPPRHRPDTTLGGVSAPTTFGEQQVAPSTAPQPTEAVKPSPGWGWRALVAFVAGGLLTGGGFAIGLQATDNDSLETDAGAVVSTSASTTAPVQAPVESAPRTIDPDAEPALAVAEALGPSVVQIETNFGIGSGVIYDDGLIMTNHHVVDGATQIVVQLKDGRRLPGQLLGSEPNVDIAVISVGEGQNLPIAPLATDERARVGQIAIAIGSPFRLQQTVTEGIVSAVDRPVPTGSVYTAMIQTDAPINPGNSGGALADREGRVIGINTAIQTDGNSNTNAGIGFAIPIDRAVDVAAKIAAGVPIESGFLGVAGDQSLDGAAGVEVTNVTPQSAAEVAGVVVGDLIISIDGAPVTAFEELAGLVVARSPGDVVVLEVVRDGQPVNIEATLGAREE